MAKSSLEASGKIDTASCHLVVDAHVKACNAIHTWAEQAQDTGVPALMAIAATCRGPEGSVRRGSRWGSAETSMVMGRRLIGRLHGLWLGGVPEMLHQTGETCR